MNLKNKQSEQINKYNLDNNLIEKQKKHHRINTEGD